MKSIIERFRPRCPRLAWGLVSSLLVSLAAVAAERPNIILCMADDQGWDETGYNGHEHLKTPVLDEMAANGLRFDRFYSAAPNCGPTRGSIMTGRHPNRYGLFGPNWAIRPEETSLATLLRRQGYATGHFGKWHLGPVKRGAPNNPGALGFDEWLSHDNYFEMDAVLSRNGAPPMQHVGESSAVVARTANQFIAETATQNRPFFAVVWFGSPHGPYIANDSDSAPYVHKVNEELANRYAEITAMDRAIGTIRQTLRELNLGKNTLFWFCSDNGVPNGVKYQPTLRGNKGNLYEGGVRVPGIIEWPDRFPSGRVTTARAVTTDILPTLCDLLDMPMPNRPIDGTSLLPLIRGEWTQRPEPIFFWKYPSAPEKDGQRWIEASLQKGTTPTVRNPGIDFLNYHHPVARTKNFGGEASVIAGHHKLIVGKRGTTELYHLENDPKEERNLAGDQPQNVRELRDQLETWQRSVERSLAGEDYRQN